MPVLPLIVSPVRLSGVCVVLACLAVPWAASAQDRIYRCGNEYTNDPGDAQARGCRLVEGGNVTVILGVRPSGNAAGNGTPAPRTGQAGAAPQPGASAPRNGNERVDAQAQRARDADARAILETELRKAESRLSGLQAEYNNGEPEKRGPEFRNHQMYLDRVAELKAGVARAQSDVDGLKRELARLSASR